MKKDQQKLPNCVENRLKKKKRLKIKDQSLRDLWGNIKQFGVYVIGIQEEVEWKNKAEKIWRNNVQNFLKFD